MKRKATLVLLTAAVLLTTALLAAGQLNGEPRLLSVEIQPQGAGVLIARIWDDGQIDVVVVGKNYEHVIGVIEPDRLTVSDIGRIRRERKENES